ncbi:hypothetical protein BGW36DRAFT_377274 [Talaromyces proteolyticus]|uniref:Zn(2)-C6 fungal-type domain-containing protein n=1 Tax=Talaromyces proteolyticus TaxID=1131652 RepID=A0AAD4KS12_9EURO|nr:uncharacterized protein BGW36DRAFT_377274 [Talaromyces proteolyticus]KAH8699094.1 hypothetical protein BGW36DRAFT_377274 [Talaromyces proteolyticus]
MPNIGRPSRDCYNCRKRRIRCDLARPECSQCRRKGYLCAGYRDELDQLFRVETVHSFISNRALDRRRASSSRPIPQALSKHRFGPIPTFGMVVDDSRNPPAYHFDKADPGPQVPIVESWTVHMLPLVMSKFSSDIRNGNSQTIYNAIPRLVSKAGAGSALHLVCDAIGRIYLSKATLSRRERSAQYSAYGKAITAINADLRDPRRWESDETLVGVFLLGIYELLSVSDFSLVVKSPGWCAHTQGLIALLDRRQARSFKTKEARDLFLAIFNALQNQALMTIQDYSWEFMSWIRHFYANCDLDELNVVRTAVFAHHCSRLCVVIQDLIDTADPELLLSIYPSILHHVESVESQTMPLSHDKFLRDCTIEHPLDPLCSPISIHNTGLWGYRSSFRMQLASQVHRLLSFAYQARGCTPEQQTHLLQAQRRCIAEFRALADQALRILASSCGLETFNGLDQVARSENDSNSYKVGLWDAFRLMWPLRSIITCYISSDWERQLANKMLSTVHMQIQLL